MKHWTSFIFSHAALLVNYRAWLYVSKYRAQRIKRTVLITTARVSCILGVDDKVKPAQDKVIFKRTKHVRLNSFTLVNSSGFN